MATFFSISGYIIAICSLDATGYPRQSISTFLERRALRILPFFWACTIAYNALSWAGSGNASLATMARTLVLWPLGELRPNVAWSLRHELAFYLLFTSCLLPMGRGHRPAHRWLLITLWCLAPLFWGLAPASLQSEFLHFLLAGGENGANLQFGAGLLIGIIQLRRPAWLNRLPTLNLWHLCLLFSTCAAIAQVSDIPSAPPRIILWTMLATIVILGAVRTMARNSAADSIALALGNSSFSLYLMHNTIILLILSLSSRLHLRLHTMPALGAFLLFCVAASITSCHLLYLFVEKPLVRYAHKMLARKRSGQRGGPAGSG